MECTNSQKILLNVDFIYFLTSTCKKYTLKPCRDLGKRFEESLRGGEVVENLEKYFECITKQLLNSTSV